MGKQVGKTRRERKGEDGGEVDTKDEQIEDDKNDIMVREKNKVHKLGGYFTKRRRFLGGGKEEKSMDHIRNVISPN